MAFLGFFAGAALGGLAGYGLSVWTALAWYFRPYYAPYYYQPNMAYGRPYAYYPTQGYW